jgi:branched-chain amino acid transport system ATP-binding protein
MLDEPTAGMSPQETDSAIALIEKIARERGLTLLFTEHDMDVVFRIAEKITVLHQGEVLAEGLPDDVRQNPDVQRVYLGEAA